MLSKIRELRRESDIDVANLLLQKNWLLIEVTTKNEKTLFLLGRVS